MELAPGFRGNAELVTEDDLRNSLVAGAILLIALATLLIGSPTNDPRLLLSGAPGGAITFIAASAVVASNEVSRRFLIQLFPSTLFLIPLAIPLHWSTDPEYGAYKLFNLLAVFLLSGSMILSGVRLVGLRFFLQLWIWSMFALLCATLVFKLRYGFLDRQVLFLLNGPIVFARLMGIAAILSIFMLCGILRYVLFFSFCLAVVWTMSKGPIIALAAATLTTLWLLPPGKRLSFLVTNVLVLGLLLAASWPFLAELDLGRLQLLADLASGDFSRIGEDFASTGIRIRVFTDTLVLISQHPFGVGLGGWGDAIRENWGLYYPHNLALELWSEAGIILGSIALLPFLMFVLRGNPALRAVSAFLLAAQMVSGDLLDARYLMVFSVLTLTLVTHEEVADRRQAN
jgi:hypothetical protein